MLHAGVSSTQLQRKGKVPLALFRNINTRDPLKPFTPDSASPKLINYPKSQTG